ncbi:hypothetical protein GHK80_25605 [Sinorhizobium medicae]|nr:hypothetical protein [Sinorhizobium medicae]
MVPARSSRHGLSCFRHLCQSQAEIPLIPAVQISRASSIMAVAEKAFRAFAELDAVKRELAESENAQ